MINVPSKLTFLIDTGADITLIKEHLLFNYIEDPNDFCRLTGITREEIRSIGSAEIKFNIENMKIDHKVQMVPETFPIDTDGILGRDFLCKYNCNIDYDKFILSMNIQNDCIEIPIQNSTIKINHISIPPRTEIIVPIKINIKEDSVVHNRQIAKGVYLANTIIPKNGIQHVKLLNVREKPIMIHNLKLNTIPLENYEIINPGYQNATNNEIRFKKNFRKT